MLPSDGIRWLTIRPRRCTLGKILNHAITNVSLCQCPSRRAVRIMEQRYFEQRAMLGGMAPGAGLFDGYRKGETDLFHSTWFAELNPANSRCITGKDVFRRSALGACCVGE